MFNIGLGELLLFIIIALVVLGPEQLPQALRHTINFYRKLRFTVQKIQDDIEKELKLSEFQDLMTEELHKVHIKEQELQQQLMQLQLEIIELNKFKHETRDRSYIAVTGVNQKYLKAPYVLSQ